MVMVMLSERCSGGMLDVVLPVLCEQSAGRSEHMADDDWVWSVAACGWRRGTAVAAGTAAEGEVLPGVGWLGC